MIPTHPPSTDLVHLCVRHVRADVHEGVCWESWWRVGCRVRVREGGCEVTPGGRSLAGTMNRSTTTTRRLVVLA
jgi:hypothetical protein